MTLRVDERAGLRKVGHTIPASVQNHHSVSDAVGFKEKPIRLIGNPQIYSMVVQPVVSRWSPWGSLDSEFPSPIGHPHMTGRASR